MERNFFPLIAGAVCLLLAATTPAQDRQMYQWTDENGVVHFSDSAPAGQQATAQPVPAVDQSTASPYSEATQDAPAQPSAAQQRREEIARKHDQAQADQAQREAQCASWQAELERLEPNRRVYFTNEQGETERMDDVERTDRVAELNGLIAENCGG